MRRTGACLQYTNRLALSCCVPCHDLARCDGTKQLSRLCGVSGEGRRQTQLYDHFTLAAPSLCCHYTSLQDPLALPEAEEGAEAEERAVATLLSGYPFVLIFEIETTTAESFQTQGTHTRARAHTHTHWHARTHAPRSGISLQPPHPHIPPSRRPASPATRRPRFHRARIMAHRYCTITVPSLHHHCTITAPSLHHHYVFNKPSLTITVPSGVRHPASSGDHAAAVRFVFSARDGEADLEFDKNGTLYRGSAGTLWQPHTRQQAPREAATGITTTRQGYLLFAGAWRLAACGAALVLHHLQSDVAVIWSSNGGGTATRYLAPLHATCPDARDDDAEPPEFTSNSIGVGDKCHH